MKRVRQIDDLITQAAEQAEKRVRSLLLLTAEMRRCEERVCGIKGRGIVVSVRVRESVCVCEKERRGRSLESSERSLSNKRD